MHSALTIIATTITPCWVLKTNYSSCKGFLCSNWLRIRNLMNQIYLRMMYQCTTRKFRSMRGGSRPSNTFQGPRKRKYSAINSRKKLILNNQSKKRTNKWKLANSKNFQNHLSLTSVNSCFTWKRGWNQSINHLLSVIEIY